MAETSITLGKYELLEVIGDGAEGRVYKAVCTSNDVPGVAKGELVALKRLKNTGHDKESQQFRRQTDILRKLNHPNIVSYKDSFVWREKELEDDIHCLVMELLDGEALKTLLERNRAGLPWEQARSILLQTLEALQHASKNGIVHRDLKLSNIYVTRQGIPKLVDFGIARVDDGEATATSSGAGAKGTFDYMAPDFALMHGGFRGDEQSDIFSFGVLLFHTLTGKLPFPALGESADRGYYIRWLGQSPPIAEFRHPVFRVLTHARTCTAKCIETDRKARFQTFDEVMKDFVQIAYRRLKHGAEAYEFFEWLGKGGFGEVFRARRVSDQREVAVKRLFSSGQSSRFVREAKILRDAAHPHLTEYVDFVEVKLREDEREYYLILEYLDGMPEASLRDRIRSSESGLDAIETLRMFVGYLDCLDHLHKNGIIHRDIKPGNLYAPANNPQKAKIFDLGIAHDEEGTRTHGQVPGTLDFMPPEFATQASGRGSAQSDIYSIGVTLYQSLTKKLPFPRLPDKESEAWIGFFKRSVNPLDCPFDHPVFTKYPELVTLLKTALAHDPKRRFPTAGVMLSEIKKLLDKWDGPMFTMDEESPTAVTMIIAPKATTASAGAVSEEIEEEPITAETKPADVQKIEQEMAAAAKQASVPAAPPVDPEKLERERKAAEAAAQKQREEAAAATQRKQTEEAAVKLKKREEEAQQAKLREEEALAAERKQFEDEAALKKKREEDERQAVIRAAELKKQREEEALAVERKRIEDEAALKKKREEDERLAVIREAALKKQREEEALAAERKRVEDEAALKKKREEDERQAVIRAAALKKQREAEALAAERKRIEDEAALKKKREDDARQEQIRAERAAKQKAATIKFAKLAGVFVAALAVILGLYVAWFMGQAKLRESAFQKAVGLANGDYFTADYKAAIAAANQALAIHSNNPEMQKLVADANEQIKLQETYVGAMKTAQITFDNQDYSNAVLWASAALHQKPDDFEATKLRDRAQKLQQQFNSTVGQAQAAYQRGDYGEAMNLADQALAIRKSDAAMLKLKTDADAQIKVVAAYREAMKNGQAAFDNQDFTNAAAWTGVALQKVPGDAAAAQLRDNAQKFMAEYGQAVSQAQAAYQRGDYAGVMNAADQALALRKNDAAMLKLKADAEGQNKVAAAYREAMKNGQAAFDNQDYTNSLAWVAVALQKVPGDAAAAKLRDATQKVIGQFNQAVSQAQAAYQRGDYAGAMNLADQALALRKNDATMLKLKTDADSQSKVLSAYHDAMKNGQGAFDNQDYANAAAWATTALQRVPGDAAATKLRDNAQQVLAQYNQEVSQAQAAYQRGDIAGAVSLADKVLAVRKNDPAMQNIKAAMVKQLDETFEKLLDSFNVSVPAEIRSPGGRKASTLGAIGDAGKPYYQAQIDRLEKSYQAGSWLGENNRQASLQSLRKAVDSWE
jgi:serine/threonine protein kinase